MRMRVDRVSNGRRGDLKHTICTNTNTNVWCLEISTSIPGAGVKKPVKKFSIDGTTEDRSLEGMIVTPRFAVETF